MTLDAKGVRCLNNIAIAFEQYLSVRKFLKSSMDYWKKLRICLKYLEGGPVDQKGGQFVQRRSDLENLFASLGEYSDQLPWRGADRISGARRDGRQRPD